MAQKLHARPEALRARGLPPSEAPPAPPDVDDTPLTRFSRELAHRFPDTLIQQFIMPEAIRQCREVFIREVTSADEVEAAIYADQTASALEKASLRLMNDAENREIVRLSIVGFGTTPNGTATLYEHVNHDGVPLERINLWPQKVWAALRSYFGQVNGVPVSELKSGIEGAQTVGAFAPPTSATQAVPVAGK